MPEGAFQIHEATAILAHQQRGTGSGDGGSLARGHGGGDLRLLDREGPAEAAALVGMIGLQGADVSEAVEQFQSCVRLSLIHI